MAKTTFRRVYLGLLLQGIESMMVEGRHDGRDRKLRTHIMNCSHKTGRANLKQGEALSSPNLLPMAYFLQ